MQKQLGIWADVEDTELVDAAQAGEAGAFDELVRRHHGTCMKLAMSVLRDREDAEDEVQNALLKASQHLEQFQRDAKFSTWLSRIVLNQCLMKLRKSRRARFLYIDDGHTGEDAITLDLPAHDPTPETRLSRQEIGRMLELEMKRIPPLLRNAFVLRDVQELPMPAVAEQLGISIAAAKSRLLRARAELQGRLERHCGRLGLATLLAEG